MKPYAPIALAILLATGLLTASPARAEDHPPPPGRIILSDALIRSIERVPFDSGIFAAWNHWTVESDGTVRDLFSLRMSGMEQLPLEGQRCEIHYHFGRLGGSIGPGLKTDRPWPMIDNFTCTVEPSPPSP